MDKDTVVTKTWHVMLDYGDYDAGGNTLLRTFTDEVLANEFAEAYKAKIESVSKMRVTASMSSWYNYSISVVENEVTNAVPQLAVVYCVDLDRTRRVGELSATADIYDVEELVEQAKSESEAVNTFALLRAINNPGEVVRYDSWYSEGNIISTSLEALQEAAETKNF